MKKFICVLFSLLLLPFSIICLSGCESDKDMSKFYTTFTSIAEKHQHFQLVEIKDKYGALPNSTKIDINYSSSPELKSKVSNSETKYYYLESYYHPLLDSSLAPLYFYGPKLSTVSVKKSTIKSLYKQLEKVDDGFDDLSYYYEILISSLQTSANEDVNLVHLSNLFAHYENLIESSITLSSTISNIYFNHILDNSTLNYSKINIETITKTDVDFISLNVRQRLPYYEHLFADIYFHLYVKDNNLPDKIVETSNFIPEYYTPKTFVDTLNTSNINSSETLLESKQDLYKNAITLYNIQCELPERYSIFNQAKEKVSYSKVKQSSNPDEQNYSKLILQFANGIAYDSYEVLLQLTNLIF